MESKIVDIAQKYELNNISKIIIKNKDEEIFIVDKSEVINEFLAGLKSVKESEICDCRPEYEIIFYKNDKIYLKIGYQNYEDHYYLRYRNEEQFIPDKKFILTFQGLIGNRS